MRALFYDKFTSQPQANARVMYNLLLRFHVIPLRCCLPENIYCKMLLSPLFIIVECKVVSIGTLFHPRATLKLDEREKFRKYAKLLIYFVQGCCNETDLVK